MADPNTVPMSVMRIEQAIREFSWGNYGNDALDDQISEGCAEWVPDLAKAIVRALP